MTRPAILFLLLAASVGTAACAEKKEQIVVPVVGKQLSDFVIARENRVAQLQEEYPDLPPTTVEAFSSIPRAIFVADLTRHRAYEDQMLPIGSEQATIKLSDIAWLITRLRLAPTDTVLEIGTGTGYMTAILARTVRQVFSVEINEYLAENARATLERFSISNVKIRIDDGLDGWKLRAPYDVIIVTAAVEKISDELKNQLNPGGRLAAPVIESPTKTPWRLYLLNENGELTEFAKWPANIPHAIQTMPKKDGLQNKTQE